MLVGVSKYVENWFGVDDAIFVTSQPYFRKKMPFCDEVTGGSNFVVKFIFNNINPLLLNDRASEAHNRYKQ